MSAATLTKPAMENAPEPARRTVSVENLVKKYRGRNVVDGVSISFSQGEIVGLLGPNGAGKTTTFYMTVGLVRPDSGSILLDGEQITRLPMHVRARKGIGYLPQEASVFRKLSVLENILLVLELVKYPAAQRKTRAMELLAELKVDHKANEKAYILSGGERRRVEIARALAADPSFLLLDEPFSGIDPKVREEICEIVRQLSQRGIGILITDHDARTTLNLIDRTYIIYEGKVVASGSRNEIASDALARKYYLPEDFTL
jgi:lipopolysaccharide export system ATP-binding protein